ncbi:MAG TPA: Na+/H+ antiporter NhaA, partial [Lentimicrobium sp.]|nr:Na+/H+ antiporter NhaA [Lentimicrobium sp.]
LMSGVHATIAAVLAAFTIPARVQISEQPFYMKMVHLMDRFRDTEPNESPTITNEQHQLLSKIEQLTNEASTPLQRLEHSMHPLVAFVIMPVFALSNSGIEINSELLSGFNNPVTLGVSIGLFAGKFIGVTGMVALMYFLKISPLPDGCNWWHMIGVGFLAAIGFTMALFITGLAFENPGYVEQAKLGIIFTSLVAGTIGYVILRRSLK